MTRETALFLLGLLDTLTVAVAAPDFDDAVDNIRAARAALREIADAE